MNAGYLARLLGLSLASFFLIHTALALAVSLLSPVALRIASRMRPQRAARFLFTLRMLPPSLAFLAVTGICVPSYLWLEPEGTAESAGALCLAAAALCLAAWGTSIARASRAVIRTSRWMARAESRSTRDRGYWFVDEAGPLLALCGIVRPRLLISRQVAGALSSEQLDAALRHEAAHRASRDNLKRLLLLITPGVLPLWRGWDALERGWAKFMEWAADDRATDADEGQAVLLAEALVRVARLGAAVEAPPLAASLIEDPADLEERIDRLLEHEPPGTEMRRLTPVIAVCALVAAACLMRLMLHPAMLSSAHELLERMMQ